MASLRTVLGAALLTMAAAVRRGHRHDRLSADFVAHSEGAGAGALTSSEAPGQRFDLSNWVLQLPIASGGSIKQVKQPELASYTSEYFNLSSDGAITMWAPVDGAHTPGSHYPRTELRETVNPSCSSDGRGNWAFVGYHELNVTTQVVKQPSTGEITVGQVHGASIGTTSISGSCSIVAEFIWTNGVLKNHVRKAPTGDENDPNSQSCDGATFDCGSYSVGETFSFSLRVVDHKLSVWTDRAGWCMRDYDYSWWQTTGPKTYWMYHKAGDYVQDDSGPSTEGGLVKIHKLQTTHRQL